MLGPEKYLFEIPIYRLSSDEYSKQREDFINKNNNETIANSIFCFKILLLFCF